MIDYSAFWQKIYHDTLHQIINMAISLWPTLWPFVVFIVVGLFFTLIRKSIVNWFSYAVNFNRRDARNTEKKVNAIFDLFGAFRNIFPKN